MAAANECCPAQCGGHCAVPEDRIARAREMVHAKGPSTMCRGGMHTPGCNTLVAGVVSFVDSEHRRPPQAFPADDWHEDIGNVLWWKLPVHEPPYAGTALDEDFPENYYTHWTRIDIPDDGRAGGK